jgi:hypothetical protein
MAEPPDLTFGRYHPGLFYSESFGGVPEEKLLSESYGVGRGDIQATMRVITLLHEGSHYVHDLSLGTCLCTEFLLDEAEAMTFGWIGSLLAEGDVVCPLIDARGDFRIGGSEAREALEVILQREWLATALLHRPIVVNTTALARDVESGLTNDTVLTGMHLLEGIVAVKTLIGLAERAEGWEDLQYLAEVAKDLPLLPDHLPPLYHLALRVYDATVGRLHTGTNPRRVRKWPYDVLTKEPDSLRKVVDTGFIYVADIALHIPPVEVILNRVHAGQNVLTDFLPVKRFLRAVELLGQHGGFPPAGAGGGKKFYGVLFDWFADQAGWIGYAETQGAWETKIRRLRDDLRREIIDGYRGRMLTARRTSPISVLGGTATDVCAAYNVPLVHLTPTGLKVLRTVLVRDEHGELTKLHMPFEFPSMPVWWVWQETPELWTNVPEDLHPADAMEIELPRHRSFLHEIVLRSMGRALYAAILREDALACPWSELGCDVARDECRRIKRLADIPQKQCSLRRYLEWTGIDPNRVGWTTEEAHDGANAG